MCCDLFNIFCFFFLLMLYIDYYVYRNCTWQHFTNVLLLPAAVINSYNRFLFYIVIFCQRTMLFCKPVIINNVFCTCFFFFFLL